MKWCGHCKKERLSSSFARNASQPDGLETWCKDCRRGNLSPAQRGTPIELTHPAAVWATKCIGQTYWQQMGEWMMGGELGSE